MGKSNSGQLSNKIKDISLIRLAAPFFAQVLIGTISAPINTFIASSINSSGLESIGSAGVITWMFGILASLLSGGAMIIVGQYIGKNEKNDNLKKATDTTFWLTVIQTAILVGFLFLTSKYLLMFLGLKDGTEVMHDAMNYIYVVVGTMMIGSLSGYFLGITATYGRPMYAMILGVAGTFLDIAVSYLLAKYSSWGVISVAAGTGFVRFFIMIISAVVYSMHVQPIWKIAKLDRLMTKRIIHVSLPIAGEKINFNAMGFVQRSILGNIAASLGLVIITHVVNSDGSTKEESHNIMIQAAGIFNSCTGIIMLGGVSIGLAIEPLLSRLYGAKQFDLAKKELRLGTIIAFCIDFPMILILGFVAPYIVDMLTTRENNPLIVSELKSQLYPCFWFLFVTESGRILNMIYIGATRSAGDTKYTMYMSIWISWVSLFISFALAYWCRLGFLGIVIGAGIDEFSRGVVNYLRYRSGKWKLYLQKIDNMKLKEKKIRA